MVFWGKGSLVCKVPRSIHFRQPHTSSRVHEQKRTDVVDVGRKFFQNFREVGVMLVTSVVGAVVAFVVVCLEKGLSHFGSKLVFFFHFCLASVDQREACPL